MIRGSITVSVIIPRPVSKVLYSTTHYADIATTSLTGQTLYLTTMQGKGLVKNDSFS